MKNSNRKKADALINLAKISEPPINLNKIASIFGFKIIPYPFPEYRKGIIFMETGIKVIGVNSNHPLPIQRFTIAHELGHLTNGHEMIEHDFILGEEKYFSRHFQQEKEADLFASELLLPKEFLIKDLNSFGIDENKLIEKYIVSKTALWIRLNTLNLAEKYSK